MKKNIIILFLLFLIMGTFFCYMYVKDEDPVYVYDYCGYQQQYIQNNEKMMENPKEGIKSIITSIRESDYNVTPILGIMFLYLIQVD